MRLRLLVAGVSVAMLLLVWASVAVAEEVHLASETGVGDAFDCLGCHPRTLALHDRLGSGNAACSVCHDPVDMGRLRLADGTRLELSDSSRLCGVCHERRYDAWIERTHGFVGSEGPMSCTGCHDAHRPQMVFAGITRPHPAPAPPAPGVPTNLLMMVIVSLVFLMGMGVVMARRARESW